MLLSLLCRKIESENWRSISPRVKKNNRSSRLRNFSVKINSNFHWVENVVIFRRPNSTVPWREQVWCLWMESLPVYMLPIPRKIIRFSYNINDSNVNFWIFLFICILSIFLHLQEVVPLFETIWIMFHQQSKSNNANGPTRDLQRVTRLWHLPLSNPSRLVP